MVLEIAYELFGRNSRPLGYMFRFAFGVNIDKNWLIHSWKFAKCRNGQGVKEWASVLLDLKNIYNLVPSFIYTNNCDFLLWFALAWSWNSFQGLDFCWSFLARLIAKILARNLWNAGSWQEMKDSKILARNSKLSETF